MEAARPYYSEGGASTAFYDLMTAADRALDQDVDLYAAMTPSGGSVLELGSGTGRISAELACRGFDVVGLEIAPAMLAQAEAKRPENVTLMYVLGDMRRFDLGRRFDSVISPYYALAHLPPAEWPLVLANILRHLKPTGSVAFHMPIAEVMAAPAPPPGSLVFRSEAPALEVFLAGKAHDTGTGRMDVILDYAPKGEPQRREYLTLFAGDLDGVARRFGLVRETPPVAFGNAGHVHIYRSKP